MRITVYKLQNGKIEKDKISDYNPEELEVLWESYEDESDDTYNYPNVSFGLLEKYGKDLFLVSEIPELVSGLKLRDKEDAFSKWLPKDTRGEVKSYYLLNSIKAAKSLLQAIYDFFKEEDVLIKIED